LEGSAVIRVRPAKAADVPFLLRCIRELADFEKLTHEVEATEDRLHSILFGAGPVAEAVVAEHEGVPAGYALYFPVFSTFKAKAGIYLEDLYVRPHLRGHGVGKALITWVARTAVQRGCSKLEWAVLDWNENAIRFYRGLGARLLRDWVICRLEGDALEKVSGEA
jgi:GNAT superfamily N-acetyltransferase